MSTADRLYHGSSVQGLPEIVPGQNSVRDPEEGPVVFATPDPALATVFAAATLFSCGYFGDASFAAFHEEDRAKIDRPGSVYHLPAEPFACDETKGMGPREWTSASPVPVLEEHAFSSVLDEMLRLGVAVYLLNDSEWDTLQTADDHGYALFRGMRSENECRGLEAPRWS